MLAAVILTGGESRRMGSPKALLHFHGHTFLEHLLEVTGHPRLGVRRVITGASHAEIVRHVTLPPGVVVMNRQWQRGQLSSIRAAIESLRSVETEGMLVALVDHPLITKTVVESLLAAFDRSPRSIVLPTWQGRRGHPVIFPARLYSELYHASDDVGARAVVWAHKNEVLEVPVDEEGIVLDIDDRATFDKLFPPAPIR
ncbi:MAG: nucleotidyltransferase family protein [Acidobacteriota bacterium]|nr:nucleotidyltransferase family protein [Acidobacteriota bacterium]